MISIRRAVAPQIVSNLELSAAAVRLFARRESGHMDRFQYSAPQFTGDMVRGAQLWADFLRCSVDYRVPQEEDELCYALRDELRQSSILSEFIDLGCGSIEAFRNKTLPLLQGARSDVYRPIDLCPSFLADVRQEARLSLPGLDVRPEQKDFLLDLVDVAHSPACIFWAGCGFSNIGSIGPTLPFAEIRSRMGRLHRFMAAGGKAIISFDVCQDGERQLQRYSHPIFADFNLNLLYRLVRDCPDISLDPLSWKYAPVWQDDRHVVEHHLISTKDQKIYLPDHVIDVRLGESFVADHSFKFPADLILRIAATAGWSNSTLVGDGDLRLLILEH